MADINFAKSAKLLQAIFLPRYISQNIYPYLLNDLDFFRRVAASKMAKLAFDDSDNEENIVNSVSKVKVSQI